MTDHRPQPPEQPLLTIDESARYLGVAYMTVYRWIRAHRLPARKYKGRWWIRPADLPPPRHRRRHGTS